jgi:hypothetical protein
MFEQALSAAKRQLGLERSGPRWDPWIIGILVGAAALAAGMALMYFFDPRQGRGRRIQTVDRAGGTVRRAARRARQGGRRVAAEAYGIQQQVRHLGPDANLPENDATLRDKVESILFRDPGVPKGDINLHAEDGVIVLKGTARTPEEINEIEKRVRSIDGVRDVRSMLHLPNMPDPQWAEAVLRDRAPVPGGGDRG